MPVDCADSSEHRSDKQGIAAEIEEVVVKRDPLNPECRCEKPGNLQLQLGSRCDEVGAGGASFANLGDS